MKRLIATLAGATLLVLIASCGGETSQEEPPEDVEALIQQALATMDGLSSYRLEMGFDALKPIVIEFAAPDSYRVQLWSADGDAGSSPITFAETIYVDDRSYGRQCETPGEGCGEWEEGERPPTVIAGPSPSFLPGWPLAALEMAAGLESLGSEELEGHSLAHVRGSVNHIRAIFENQRRAFAAAGITTFSTECESSTGGQLECRDLGYEETIEREDHLLRYYDVQPAELDVWLAPDDSLVHRIRLDIPPHDDPYAANRDSGEAVVTIDYSRFNEISIEAP